MAHFEGEQLYWQDIDPDRCFRKCRAGVLAVDQPGVGAAVFRCVLFRACCRLRTIFRRCFWIVDTAFGGPTVIQTAQLVTVPEHGLIYSQREGHGVPESVRGDVVTDG